MLCLFSLELPSTQPSSGTLLQCVAKTCSLVSFGTIRPCDAVCLGQFITLFCFSCNYANAVCPFQAVANLEGPGAQLQSKTEAIAQYLHTNAGARHLSDKTLSYLKKSWAIDKGVGTKQFDALLPIGLRATFWKEMRLHYLRGSRFFSPGQCSVKVLTALAQAMVSHHFSPGDTLYHQGNVPLAQMYFVHSGVVESRLSMDVQTTVDSSGATQRHFTPSARVHVTPTTAAPGANQQGWSAVKSALKTFKFGSKKKTQGKGIGMQAKSRGGGVPKSTTTLITLCNFEQGSCFGEFALMLGRKAHTSTTANMYCEVRYNSVLHFFLSLVGWLCTRVLHARSSLCTAALSESFCFFFLFFFFCARGHDGRY